jgi:hypothetical protein
MLVELQEINGYIDQRELFASELRVPNVIIAVLLFVRSDIDISNLLSIYQ